MKKYSLLLLVTIFSAALLTGCGCRNSKPAETSMPTVPSTMATEAQPTTPPTTNTVPSTDATIEDGNGPLPTNATAGPDGDTSGATDSTDTNDNQRRSRPANTNPTTGIDGRTHRIMPQK